MSNLSEILRRVANTFAELADELDEQNMRTNARLDTLEAKSDANNQIIKDAARRNILTNGIVATYPFISSTIFDKDGIFIGSNMDNESLIFINKL